MDLGADDAHFFIKGDGGDDLSEPAYNAGKTSGPPMSMNRPGKPDGFLRFPFGGHLPLAINKVMMDHFLGRLIFDFALLQWSIGFYAAVSEEWPSSAEIFNLIERASTKEDIVVIG